MAMTKTEKAEMDALRTARDMARSLRWPEYAIPEQMTEAEIRENMTFKMNPRYGQDQYACLGWVATLAPHSWGKPEVRQHFSNGVSNTNDPAGQSWSQGMGRIYRTPLEALQMLRLETTTHYAERLVSIDTMIAEKTNA